MGLLSCVDGRSQWGLDSNRHSRSRRGDGRACDSHRLAGLEDQQHGIRDTTDGRCDHAASTHRDRAPCRRRTRESHHYAPGAAGAHIPRAGAANIRVSYIVRSRREHGARRGHEHCGGIPRGDKGGVFYRDRLMGRDSFSFTEHEFQSLPPEDLPVSGDSFMKIGWIDAGGSHSSPIYQWDPGRSGAPILAGDATDAPAP